MPLGLGNNLIKNGVAGNPDGLSLDLQFAADKTLTARKGPTPVFTRANANSSFIGSDGLIQTATTNVARFDHDPITLECKGLLIEEQRTNLLFPSTTLGTQTRVVGGSIQYVLSFYGTGSIVLSGAHVATVTGTGAYPTRTTYLFTPTDGNLTLTVTGSVTSAQLEVGTFATSWIPTAASARTRSADVCSITGSNFTGMYSQTEGSMLVNAFTPASGIRNIVSSYSAGFPFNKEVTLLTNASAAELEVVDGVSQVDMSSGSPISPNTAFKLACAYKLNDFALTKNGVAPQTDTSGTVPTVDTMRVGSGLAGNTMCGCVSSLRYYKKRLSDAKLQTLTT